MRTGCTEGSEIYEQCTAAAALLLALLSWGPHCLEIFRVKAPRSDSKGTTKNVLKRTRESPPRD